MKKTNHIIYNINIHCTTFNLGSLTPNSENDLLPIFMDPDNEFVPDIYVVAL